MPLRDVAAMNASLDNDYGTTRGPNAAAQHELALFAGDPMIDGVEISGGGYARVFVLPADWLAAADGMKELAAPVEFPAITAAWSDTVTHYALVAAGEVMWDCGPLATPLEVTGAGRGPKVSVSLFYDDAVTEAP